jgi:hypothetical protein
MNRTNEPALMATRVIAAAVERTAVYRARPL